MRTIDERTRAGVASRARVDVLVASSVPDALAEARANPHPWYRCQSLASVAAEIADDAEAMGVLQEALDAAKEQDEPNRVVTVAAWPLSVLVRRSLRDVSGDVADLLAIIAPEPNPVRRADALLMLLQAVMRDRDLRDAVLAPLLHACAESRGWKARQILGRTALSLAAVNGKLAQEVIARIPESREARRARQRLKRRVGVGEQEFVPWYRTR
jgi:hypothetical protein